MTEKVGIESIETVIAFFCGVGVDVEASLADGKFTVTDLPRFLDDLLKVPGVGKAIIKVPAEFEDLSEEEQNSIIALIQDKLSLPEADVKAVAIAAMKMVLASSKVFVAGKELVAAIKALKHPEVA